MNMLRSVSFLKCLFVILIVSISFVSNASATLVVGSSGTVDIIGNDSTTNGTYKIHVVYSIYDGSSNSDPLGKTNGYLQFAFTLTHLGSINTEKALKVGRFLVYAPSPASTTTAFYTNAYAVGSGIAPSGPTADSPWMDIDPPPIGANRGKWSFESSLGSPTFSFGSTSQTLVLTLPNGSFAPSNNSVILEIDTTSTSPSISSDVTINFAPEPASLALFGIASLFGLRRRRKV
jgi:hypothetical protein